MTPQEIFAKHSRAVADAALARGLALAFGPENRIRFARESLRGLMRASILAAPWYPPNELQTLIRACVHARQVRFFQKIPIRRLIQKVAPVPERPWEEPASWTACRADREHPAGGQRGRR
jgi:hypothetical protein